MSQQTADHRVAGQTVLVTGGGGFIGSHLASALAPDNDVRVLDDLSAGSRQAVPDEATLVVGDVRDEKTLRDAAEGVDLVFHEAAQVSVERSVENPRETTETNVTGTVAVLEAARRADARVVLASSAAVYGEPQTVPIGEDQPIDPQSPYGLSKRSTEQHARLYADLYGLPATPLRYFNVYGPGQGAGDYAGVIATFLDQARRGEPITVAGDGKQTRDFVHVRDVVRANLLAAVVDSRGQPFNVGTGDRVTIQELAATIKAVTGSDAPIVNVEPRKGDIRHSCADVTAAREHLGFEPSIQLEAGLETVVPTLAPDGH